VVVFGFGAWSFFEYAKPEPDHSAAIAPALESYGPCLRDLGALFARLETSVVASTYCNSWVFDALDPRDPLRSMAQASLELFIARAEGPKHRYLEAMVREFAVDGVVFHDSRTCPNNSNARFGLPQRLRRATGTPVLVIDGDLNDLRCFSDEQAHTNIEGFVEQLEGAAPPAPVSA
jgi:benzoyl-CoA reductase/2-hydroxyglutaryl-CoA dehydratase subunit BcrC/BadD/HgdB